MWVTDQSKNAFHTVFTFNSRKFQEILTGQLAINTQIMSWRQKTRNWTFFAEILEFETIKKLWAWSRVFETSLTSKHMWNNVLQNFRTCYLHCNMLSCRIQLENDVLEQKLCTSEGTIKKWRRFLRFTVLRKYITLLKKWYCGWDILKWYYRWV
jgi:hypothetical protein